MNYTMMAQASELAGWNKESEALSVYQAMQQLEDRRKNKGKRYSLALVLTLIILAKMAGETTLQAVSDWVRYRSAWLQDVLPDTRATFPCVATYSNVLRAVDPAQVNQKLMDLLIRVRAQKRVAREQEHIILDGKTLRGTQHHLAKDQQKMHHVACYEAQTGIVIKEHIVAEKEGELTHVSAFLTPLFLQGRILSADALYTQKSICQQIIASGGEYLFFVKQNQPTLAEDLRLFFGEPPLDCLDWRTQVQTDKGHGRLTCRFIQASTELNDFLARDWHEVGQVFCLRRRVEYPLRCTQEYVYGITSLTPQQATPLRLLQLIRDHWRIENRLHWHRDVTLQEDACQIRKGCAPHTLAVLHSFLLALFDFCGVTNVRQQMRCFDAHPLQALQLLLKALGEN
ncbi:ISAs1 family transposase [Ktedonosporobacter rubrisoli]|uniref:ISAs1 family transposase n=1 Tax=Ktedonosporobacter rubrisoli TaxID=2509675 RepID=A0A4P6JY96_KTERU|nr:ISAs1 family transposase [Ktedonosporobacter rubrisoli]QBD80433.1 ISAs1 family transposase [Ktedonosporobacter rubrisoli]